MSTPLTTADGFPRADIDVAQGRLSRLQSRPNTHLVLVRMTRSRIIHLKNDYKALMTVIEKKIHEYFANNIPIEPSNSEASPGNRTLAPRPAPLDAPFAKVNSVVSGSPAETAGLRAGDEIRNFGYVNHRNHDNLKRVAECVQGNEGVSSSHFDAWRP